MAPSSRHCLVGGLGIGSYVGWFGPADAAVPCCGRQRRSFMPGQIRTQRFRRLLARLMMRRSVSASSSWSCDTRRRCPRAAQTGTEPLSSPPRPLSALSLKNYKDCGRMLVCYNNINRDFQFLLDLSQ